MLDSFFLLRAMNGIREEDLIIAQEFLEYTDTEPQNRSYRKLISYALLAAILITLLSVTAYALGWFGLRERSFTGAPPADPQLSVQPSEQVYYVSANGIKDSPEYQANAEWKLFWQDYVDNTEINFDSSFLNGKSADYIETCHYYGCYDQVMADKLYEIAEKYGLGLHTLRLTPVTLEDFYRIAGTGPFLAEGGTGGGYIYEDGSFKMEGEVDTGDSIRGFTFEKFLSGMVMPYTGRIEDPANYTEWEYTNIYGDPVLISSFQTVDETGKPIDCAEIFYGMDGVFLNVSCGSWHEDAVDPESIEKMADAFIFHEATKSDVNIAYASHGPMACEDPGDAATLADFLASKEGKAAMEYYDYAYSQVGENADMNYNPWYLPQEALLDKIKRLSEQYSLAAPSQFGSLVVPQEELDQGWHEIELDVVSAEDILQLGYSREMLEQLELDFYYDNGVLDGHCWQYIPKGALCINLGALPREGQGESWFYRTAKGFVVYIIADLEDTRWPDSHTVIIYEGKDGWFIGHPAWYNTAYEIEATADRIDFSLFD